MGSLDKLQAGRTFIFSTQKAWTSLVDGGYLSTNHTHKIPPRNIRVQGEFSYSEENLAKQDGERRPRESNLSVCWKAW